MSQFTFDATNHLLVTGVGGGASTVNIQDTAGNALTSTAGALNVFVTSPIVASNPSVGLTGAAAPTFATEIGIVVGGNLVNISAANPLPDNLIQVAGVSLGATAVTNFGVAPAATAVPGVNASIFAGTTGITATGSSLNANITNTVPVTLASTTITGTVAVTQSTSPWVVSLASTTVTNTVAENLTQVAGVVLGATAVTAYGTAPAAANVPGVNAFITNTPAVTLASTTITGNVTVVQPTGTNLHVVVDSGSSLTAAVTGTKSNNAVVPGATNLGVLPAIANAATQVWTEGNQVLESVDLSGRQRVRGTLTHNNAAPSTDLLGVMNGLANAVAPTYTEGDIVLQSVDLSGNTRVIGIRTNNAAVPSFNMGVLPALANAASPAWTEGFQVLESVDLTGRQRIRGTLTNNNAAPTADLVENMPAIATTAAPSYTTGNAVMLSTDLTGQLRVTPTTIGTLTNNNAAPGVVNLGVLPALANAANPTWTEGNQVLESVDLSGRQRIMGQVAADAAFTGNPVVVAGVDNAGVVQELPVADRASTTPTQTLVVGGTDVVAGTVLQLPVVNVGTALQNAIPTTASVAGGDGITNAALAQPATGTGTFAPLWVVHSLFGGTTWDRARTANIGNAVGPTGIAASAAYGEYLTAAPAPTTGQYSALQTDYAGSLFTKPIRRSTTAASKATITNSAVAVTVMPAQAAGIFADISHLSVTVTPAATVSLPFTLTLSDGTATYVWDMETGALATSSADGTVLQLIFTPPIPATTAATAWTVATNVATVVVHAVAVAILQKAS